jgi:hypothetical protein
MLSLGHYESFTGVGGVSPGCILRSGNAFSLSTIRPGWISRSSATKSNRKAIISHFTQRVARALRLAALPANAFCVPMMVYHSSLARAATAASGACFGCFWFEIRNGEQDEVAEIHDVGSR